MSTYTPDRWEVLEFRRGNDEPVYRVFAGWYGSYLGSDSWQLNSGIVKVVDTGDAYEFYGHSGSVYTCYKASQSMSGYMLDVYTCWQKEMAELPGYALKVSGDWLERVKSLS
jgi:hypothetical protein